LTVKEKECVRDAIKSSSPTNDDRIGGRGRIAGGGGHGCGEGRFRNIGRREQHRGSRILDRLLPNPS
jgi:hypothetical protein